MAAAAVAVAVGLKEAQAIEKPMASVQVGMIEVNSMKLTMASRN